MGEILEWKHLTGRAIDALPRDRTIVYVSSSPLEVHGPHLPTLTDICEAEGLTQATFHKLMDRHPDLIFLGLPPIYVAADVLPHVGSLKFRQSTITRVFEDLGRSLCAQGFRRIWVGGFHGGPRHFVSVERAAARVNRRYGGEMVSVFSLLMSHLTGGSSDLTSVLEHIDGVERVDLEGDAHGGVIETSIMLQLLGAHVDGVYAELGPNTLDRKLAREGQAPLAVGSRPTVKELLRGFKLKLKFYEEETYSGAPSKANAVLGQQFIDVLSDRCADALEEVLSGQRGPADCHSPAWPMRWLFTSELLSQAFERVLDYRNKVW